MKGIIPRFVGVVKMITLLRADCFSRRVVPISIGEERGGERASVARRRSHSYSDVHDSRSYRLRSVLVSLLHPVLCSSMRRFRTWLTGTMGSRFSEEGRDRYRGCDLSR